MRCTGMALVLASAGGIGVLGGAVAASLLFSGTPSEFTARQQVVVPVASSTFEDARDVGLSVESEPAQDLLSNATGRVGTSRTYTGGSRYRGAYESDDNIVTELSRILLRHDGILSRSTSRHHR